MMENKQLMTVGAVLLVLVIGAVVFFAQKSQDGALAGEAKATSFSASEENCFRSSDCSTSYGNCIKLKCSGLGLAKDCRSKCLETSLKSVSVKEVPAYQKPVAPASAKLEKKCIKSDAYEITMGENYLNLYKAGITKEKETQTTIPDTCLDEKTLIEAYCNPASGEPATLHATCLGGCKNGACIPAEWCTDSDGGKEGTSLMVKGTVIGNAGLGSINEKETDYCFEGKVMEHYCLDSSIYQENTIAKISSKCPLGTACDDGACVPRKSSSTSGRTN